MRRFTTSPCPVCGQTSKGCSAPSELHLCRGVARSGWNKTKDCDNGFSCYVKSDGEKPCLAKLQHRKVKTDNYDWIPLVHRYIDRLEHYSDLKQELANKIGLPVEVLDRFGIGIKRIGSSLDYTIPEFDGKLNCVGIAIRSESDRLWKGCIKGSKRGLVVPERLSGPCYIVEGFTDCAAMNAAGLCSVGRPTNCGGSDYLIELLKDFPDEIVVVGENDWRICKQCDGVGCVQCSQKGWLFPGRDGAISVMTKLKKRLKQHIRLTMPPLSSKDVREYLTSDELSDITWKERGQMLISNWGK